VPIVALMPVDHPLADPNGVSLEALAGEPFIDFPAGFGNRRIVDAAYQRLGLTRSVAVEVNDTGDAAAYVQLGLGVSLVPSIAFGGGPGDGVRATRCGRPALGALARRLHGPDAERGDAGAARPDPELHPADRLTALARSLAVAAVAAADVW